MTNKINRIGIEFEGFWKYSTIDDLEADQPPWLEEIKHDGSLNEGDYGYTAREITTNPLTIAEADKALADVAKLQASGAYKLDRSVGLHYHISIDEALKPFIINTEFYEAYKALFIKTVPTIYSRRKDNSYCKFVYPTGKLTTRHFSFGCSTDRYNAINYCWSKHNTIEFRAYGGEGATISELKKLIHATIKLLNTWEGHYRRLNRKVIAQVGRGNRYANYNLAV